MDAIVNDGPCTITGPAGQQCTSGGAHLDDAGGVVYVEDWQNFNKSQRTWHTGNVTTWHGEKIGRYVITGLWTWGSATARVPMASIRVFSPDGREYVGRFGYKNTQAVYLRRSK